MRRRMMTPWIAAVLLALFGAATPAHAQESGTAALEDGRWLPYVGCWVDVDAPLGPMLCVVPEGAGVAFLTVSAGEVADRRVLEAGADRPLEAAGCAGAETATFSRDGHRVFTRTRLTCGGTDRATRGLIAMVEPDRWIEVRAPADRADGAVWVKRYRPAPVTRVEMDGLAGQVAAGPPRALASARAAAARSIRVEDLIEAHAATHPEAVRAWLMEDGEPLRIDADALVRLADAGVEPAVIDVAIAVSFPDRFAVARGPGERSGRAIDSQGVFGDYAPLDRYRYDGLGWWSGWSPFGPGYYDPFYYRYGGYYGYGGLYGPGWTVYRPTRIVVVPTAPGDQGGRAVRGRGYTRGSGGGTATRPSVRSTGTVDTRGGAATRGESSSGSKGKAKPRGGG
ncbi:MAG: hypothetical protein ACN0LA_07160 [Candidatus Longimicrobiales bacterium M2_2A_002]